MKLLPYVFALFLFFFAVSLKAQRGNERYYYKDTTFEFAGLQIKTRNSMATEDYFKSAITITNTSNQFVIVDPQEIFSYDRFDAAAKKIVIQPKQTRIFTVKFIGKELRKSLFEIDFRRLQLTDAIESVYEITDFDIYNESSKQVGPVTWTLKKVIQNPKEDNVNLRIDGSVQYTGNKFLVINFDNICVKTNDGNTYKYIGKLERNFFVKNRRYYDSTKPFEKQSLMFPVLSNKIDRVLEPKLYFSEVFMEYSLVTIEGFKIKLRQGTFDDFNSSAPEKDTDENE